MKEKTFDLQDRLIDYAVRIIGLSETWPDTKAGRHILLNETDELISILFKSIETTAEQHATALA